MSSTIGWLVAASVASPLLAVIALGCWSIVGIGLTERRVTQLKAASLHVSILGAVMAAVTWIEGGASPRSVKLGTAYMVGTHGLDVVFCVDGLTMTMLVLTTVFSAVIGRFSASYLHKEPGHLRFVALLLLAEGALLLMFTAGNLDLFFAGWEMLGAVSAMLVCYFWHRHEPLWNAMRAYVVYKACDVGLLIAILLTHSRAGTVRFDELESLSLHSTLPGQLTPAWATTIGLLLVIAAMGKSAQIPFSGWLPRAMEGPTPSSSIFYGALSIHAGAFLLLRCEPLLASAPLAQAAVVALGLGTAILGTLTGSVQTEAKSILAYASMVQVSVILVEIGLGWPRLALTHLVGHALVRTLQFLRAPSALHDFHVLDAAAGGKRLRTGVHLEVLPHQLRLWLYRFALERGFLDTLLDRLVATPGLQFAAVLGRLERGVVSRMQRIEDRLLGRREKGDRA